MNVAQVTAPILGRLDLHLASSTIGLVIAASGACGVAANLAVGRRTHVSHPRPANLPRIVVSGLLASTAGIALYASARGTAQYLVAALLSGIGSGTWFPGLVTMSGAQSDDGSERGVARFGAALSLSLMVGPLAEAGVLGAAGGSLRTALWAFAALPLLGAVAVTMAGRSGGTASGTALDLRDAGPTRPARAKATFRLALWLQVASSIPFVAVVSFGGLFAASTHHVGARGVTLLFSAFFAVSLAIRSHFARTAPIRRKEGLVRAAIACDVTGVVLLVLPWTPSFVAGMLVLGAAHGISAPTAWMLLAERLPRSRVGTANARLTAAVSSVSVVAPAAVGALATAAGYRSAFAIVLLPLALAGRTAVRAGSPSSRRPAIPRDLRGPAQP
jgi:MFS family permease